jgi:diacylglycerol O-acyltransferase
MPTLMPPTDSVFLLAETREHPMHVGGLQLFVPPDGASALDVRAQFESAVKQDEVGPLFRKRPVRSITTLGQWAWDADREFDLEHHVRFNALPEPGRVLELLSLCSRLHSTLLDRHRPLWEMHLIEGLHDGRFAVYFKVHHALVDGVSALRVMSRSLSTDAAERGMPAPWAPREPRRKREHSEEDLAATLRRAASLVGDTVGLVPVLQRALRDAVRDQAATMSFRAPQTMLNARITGARRFAAQSWPVERIKAISRGTGTTVNDVVLAMCSGALRAYLTEQDALPDEPLIAMVPVSLHGEDGGDAHGGNAVGAAMCNLGTDLADPADRLTAVHESMRRAKEFFKTLTPTQIIAMSALGLTGLAVQPVLGLVGRVRPPFNLVISNVPGPRTPLYWNGARLDGLYPLSIPLDGQALNITCTSYSHDIAFGLIGCRRTGPHLQRLLTHLDDELAALEKIA